jgi:NitT/TauT family transport system substrate-binding protein
MGLMWVRGLALCVCTALLAACGNGGSPASAPAATTAPAAPAPTSAAAAAAAQPASSPATLHYAVVGVSWASAPDIVAQEKGFYKAENLTVETVVAGQSASACQQVLAKAAEIGGCSISDQIQAVEAANAPLVQVFRAYAQPLNYRIMAKPEIKTWADLKGKVIMVGGPKDNTVYFTRAMARPNELKDEDYQFQFAGASSARFAALKAGAVDAAILTDPFDFNAQQEGFSTVDTLVPKYANGDNYGYSIHLVSREWAKDHGDEIVRYIRAYLTAIKWMYDPANKDEFFTVVGPKMNLDRPGFDRLYMKDIQDSKFWSVDGEITESGTLGVEKSLADLGVLSEPLPPPTKYYDLTWWKQARATMK